jgi:excisionase family DNA binding protein
MATYVRSESRLLAVGEAASILNVHPNTLRRWAQAGLLPSWRVGPRRDRRFRLAEILSFMEVELARRSGSHHGWAPGPGG